MMDRHLRLSTLLNKALALEGNRASEIRSELIAHGPQTPLATGHIQAESPYQRSEESFFYWGVPLQRHGNVGVIPISGILLSGPGGYLYPYVSFYEDIRARLDEALDDPHIQAIALWIDSPGGMVAQCFELSAYIAQSRSYKPIVSIIYDMAASAAYALASAADTITLPETGLIGSIGVIMIHADYSSMLEKEGIKTTIFRYGAHKAELQEVETPTPDAIKREQALIDSLGEKFTALIAHNRGLDPPEIRAQEAEVFLGQRGVTLGLADNVLPPHDALKALIKQFSS